MRTLYKKDQKGSMRFWSIKQQGDELVMKFGLVGGEIQTQVEVVNENSIREIDDQMDLRMARRIEMKRRGGYCDTAEDARKGDRSNQLGLPKPMKAKRFDKIGLINMQNAIIQYKYNGHRCMITKRNGEMLAYSNGGIIIDTIPEILEGIDMDEGMTIDGELYIHGVKLQTISSYIKRRQEMTKSLKFHMYDFVSDDTYFDRLVEMGKISLYTPLASLVPNFMNVEYEQIPDYLKKARAQGYEGLMIRRDGFGYEDAKRSSGIIKVKSFLDDEFLIIGIKESRDGWGVLICETAGGRPFRASAPGTMEQKIYALNNREKIIGKMVNIEYAELTKDKIPSGPIATLQYDIYDGFTG